MGVGVLGLPKAKPIELSGKERRSLRQLVRAGKTPQRLVLRASIVLESGRGRSNGEIAKKLGVTRNTVCKWRNRYAESRRVGLDDAFRSGAPATISPVHRHEVIALACGAPQVLGEPYRTEWTLQSIASRTKMSKSSVHRILQDADIKPHQYAMWLHSPDPLFREKLLEIVRLYLNPPKDAVLLCIDEKTGIQALERKYPGRPPQSGSPGRYEFEYIRHGTRCLLAAFEVKTGKVFGQVRKRRTAKDTLEFMNAVAEHYPGGKIHVIWDNLNTHLGERWEIFNKKHRGRFVFHYTPLHASWLNQVELWFGILTRRILRRGSFGSLQELIRQLEGFMRYWSKKEAKPFRWTFQGYPLQSGLKKAA